MKPLVLICSATLNIIWGIAHLIPTRSVVKNFGDISTDNRRIITMEWITEGVTLIFLGILTLFTALLDSTSIISTTVFIAVICMLVVMSLISIFTGFKIRYLPFRLCPVIFMLSAILILLGLI